MEEQFAFLNDNGNYLKMRFLISTLFTSIRVYLSHLLSYYDRKRFNVDLNRFKVEILHFLISTIIIII